jgi:pyruvate/2-oxoglutarate dehydrogenase complex dihydrolipoamide dehydrogenase (E3) component
LRTFAIDAVPIEYDLIIIGAADVELAQLAAQLAVQHHARVALVESPTAPQSTALPQICAALSRFAAVQQRFAAAVGPGSGAINWAAVAAAAEGMTQRQQVRQDPSRLAALGVDCIVGSGAFYRKPRLGLEVNGRQLRSRAYLLALGPTYRASDPVPLPQSGFDRRACLTPSTLAAALAAGTVGPTLAIVGGDATAVSLAQSLQRLGFTVILLTDQAQILSAVDPEAAGLVQALLEAEGVQIWTQTAVTQIATREGHSRLQVLEGAGPREIAVDTVVVVTESGFEPAMGLNLAAAQVQWNGAGILVDDRQRTSGRRIYACQERRMLPQVVQNALFPWARRIDRLPVAIVDCDPPLASVGLTEAAARWRYGTDLQVLRQPIYSLTQLQDAPTGFCKLMVRRQGTLVGGQIIGPGAIELAHTLALAIQSQVPLQKFVGGDLIAAPLEHPRSAAILSQLALQWQQQRSAANPDWLEVWFDGCRAWAR